MIRKLKLGIFILFLVTVIVIGVSRFFRALDHVKGDDEDGRDYRSKIYPKKDVRLIIFCLRNEKHFA